MVDTVNNVDLVFYSLFTFERQQLSLLGWYLYNMYIVKMFEIV